MKVSYFPGCTLRTKAKDLDLYARKSAAALGVEMCEIPDWQCCGGVFVSASDEIASKLAAVRALVAARDAGQPLVTVCAACHNVMKQTNNAFLTDPHFDDAVNRYMAQEKEPKEPYHGEARVLHFLELLRDEVGFDALKKAVKNPLTGKKIAAYYGCMLLRPGKVMQFDDVENPQLLEELIRALGAEPVLYPMRNECCGGYVALEDAASANGSAVPVVYFTELLAEALGVKEDTHAE